MQQKRRSDIQVLRAVAVISVVAYHAELPISSGFIGVDIFFVISGYVISASLLKELSQNGGIRFKSFYWRRFKRLAPNLSLMVASVCAISIITLSPLGAIQTVSITSLGSLFSLGNVVIAYSVGDYFSQPAANNPLTHTWSLSVEEQFYLVLPMLIFLVFKITQKKIQKTRKILFRVILLLSSVSLVSAFYSGSLDPFSLKSAALGYYSPISRTWELGAGVLTAFLIEQSSRPRASKIYYSLGLLVIAICLFAPSHYFNSPGVFTLILISSTAGIILIGSDRITYSKKIFGNKFLLYIGDRSYSIYLWHWPFLVFAKFLFPNSALALYIGLALSFIPSLLSYRLIERPLNQINNFRSKKSKILLVLICTLIPSLIATTIGLVAQISLRPSLSRAAGFYDGQIGEADYYRYIAQHFPKCEPPSIQSLAQTYPGGYLRCQQSKPPSRKVDIALIGDSHAEDLFYGLAMMTPNKNIAFYTQGLPIKKDDAMRKIIAAISQTASIKIVILNAAWAERGFPESDISNTVSTFLKAGKIVYLGDDRPFFAEPSTCKYGIGGFGLSAYCHKGINYESKLRMTYFPKIEALLREYKALHFLPMFKEFCGLEECSMTNGKKILYRDGTHLNIDGSYYLWNKLFRDSRIKDTFSR